MAEIKILSEDTIDKIAAGEVVERPMSVVKELVENAMDAGSTAITVEIKNGGIDLIRVTDNGQGIEAAEIRLAFARHATSKIRSAEDLTSLSSMGFRGEALSSIAAVAQVEVVTKTRAALTGIRYTIEGAMEKDFEEVGAPDGTTFLVKNLFFNTPVRRKFLKQPQTEGSYVAELLERLAMSRPDISFKFVQNGQVKFHTPGNGDLKEVIYRIYGREIANHLVPIEINEERLSLKGFLGKPEINRSNRNFEHYFINARYVKSKVLAKAIEDGYKQYVMQHKFPFVVLHFSMPAAEVDVNVHPTKMEVRFSDEQYVYKTVMQNIISTFRSKELIVNATFGKDTKESKKASVPVYDKAKVPEPYMVQPKEISSLNKLGLPAAEPAKKVTPFVMDFDYEKVKEPTLEETYKVKEPAKSDVQVPETTKPLENIQIMEATQSTLFEEQFLSETAKETYDILGQIFGTYWIVSYADRMYLIDQHAAHEKVKYERLIKAIAEKQVLTQSIMPPVILQTSAKEEQVILEHLDAFLQMGFEIEEFGDHAFCLRAVPVDLYGCSYQELFRELMDEMMDGPLTGAPEVVMNKLASMACKAAVKGNMKISHAEAVKLIDELLTLENPYHCPHGRPTIISMTKQEIEKKFKRIV
ncbi:MAG: DNA mismatch repair endonuclease MutL [Lachnospiraceae bacterium]|nr:DNA mismatch repair endonuclease MutL [Lachnospiraceae bacterium]